MGGVEESRDGMAKTHLKNTAVATGSRKQKKAAGFFSGSERGACCVATYILRDTLSDYCIAPKQANEPLN